MNTAQEEHDILLMLRIKEGEDQYMDLLSERYRTPVIRFIRRKVRNHAIAEELAQSVFLKMFLARHTYEPTGKIDNWVFRIASNLALNWIRDNRKEHEHLVVVPEIGQDRKQPFSDAGQNVVQRLLRETQQEEVRRAVADLPERQRSAVILQMFQDLEYTEIAEIMGCTQGAVKSLIFRAHHTLRGRLSHLNIQRGSGRLDQRRSACGQTNSQAA